jgi:hypothetical protein
MARKAAVDPVEDLDLEDFDDVDEETEAKASKGKGKSKSKKAAEPRGLGAREVAEHLGAEPKTFRAWLRRKVASGDVVIPGGHDAKTRYDFGASFDTPLVKQIGELWNSESHERGAGIEKAQAARKAKQEAAAKTTAKPKAKTAKK